MSDFPVQSELSESDDGESSDQSDDGKFNFEIWLSFIVFLVQIFLWLF